LSGSQALQGVAILLKRVKNISKGVSAPAALADIVPMLVEPAERALADALEARAPGIAGAAARGDYREAFTGISSLQPLVATFFDDVLVMVEDERLRSARLGLVATLRELILGLADLSEMATEGVRSDISSATPA
jgi:glycyl-tRNA synthetase beta chain